MGSPDGHSSTFLSLLLGAGAAIGARALLPRAVKLRFERDIERLNAGEHSPLLSAFSEDAVLHFNDGAHRWAGEHRGREAIERFLLDYTAAGLQGELGEVWISGPPWALKMVASFHDWADGPDGERLYENRVLIVIHTRWGRVIEQWDFYEDTGRILEFDRRLSELGVYSVQAQA
jgi:ketosteroid isomerase-like protein